MNSNLSIFVTKSVSKSGSFYSGANHPRPTFYLGYLVIFLLSFLLINYNLLTIRLYCAEFINFTGIYLGDYVGDEIRVCHFRGLDGGGARHPRPRWRPRLSGRRAGLGLLSRGHVPEQSARQLREPDAGDIRVILAPGSKVAGNARERGKLVSLVCKFAPRVVPACGIPLPHQIGIVGNGAGGCLPQPQLRLAEKISPQRRATGVYLAPK